MLETFDNQPIVPGSEDAIEGFKKTPEGRITPGIARQSPFGWDANSPTSSVKVGWLLKEGGNTVANFAFSINPQSISRVSSSRTQMFATKGGLYVDDFGGGPTTIQINQLVASGERLGQPRPGYETLREHVLRFYDEIWVQAVGRGYGTSKLEVWFYDNHFWHGREAAGVPERVYFPAQSLQIMRSVAAHNVWQVQIQMIGLEKPNEEAEKGNVTSHHPGTRIIIVAANETLTKISRKLAGKNPNSKRIKQIENFIIHYNPNIKKTRKLPIFDPSNPTTPIAEITIPRLEVRAGEKLTVPANTSGRG